MRWMGDASTTVDKAGVFQGCGSMTPLFGGDGALAPSRSQRFVVHFVGAFLYDNYVNSICFGRSRDDGFCRFAGCLQCAMIK